MRQAEIQIRKSKKCQTHPELKRARCGVLKEEVKALMESGGIKQK